MARRIKTAKKINDKDLAKQIKLEKEILHMATMGYIPGMKEVSKMHEYEKKTGVKVRIHGSKIKFKPIHKGD